MPKPREELRRGLRALIERTSREMEALGDPSSGDTEPEKSTGGAASQGAAPDAVAERPSESDAAPTSPASTPASAQDPNSRPMLLLVRNTVRTLIGTREAPSVDAPSAAPSAAPATAPSPPPAHREPGREPGAGPVGPEGSELETLHLVHPRRGVCESYYINHACWEVPDAFCNHALHTCMLRDCPVYNLHREDLERRFASRYSHLW